MRAAYATMLLNQSSSRAVASKNNHAKEKVSRISTSTPTVHADYTDRDTLHLLVQSPFVLFAYWQLSSRKAAMIHEHFGKDWLALQPGLRIYDVTGLSFDGSAANEAWELPLPQGESCFLQGFRPSRHYAADLGIMNGHGQFLPLLRSNTVMTPAGAKETASAPSLPEGNALSAAPLAFTLIKPFSYDQFSAYSVYPVKETDADSGGDSE